MNTEALFPCGGGSNLILGIGMESQVFILRTRYLESSVKSEKIHKYYRYRAIITEIYKAQWKVLMEIQPFQNSNQGLISRQKTSLGIMVWMTRQN